MKSTSGVTAPRPDICHLMIEMVKDHLAKMVINTLITTANGGKSNVYTESLSKENPIESHFFKERNDGFGGHWYLLKELLEDRTYFSVDVAYMAGHF